MVLSHLLKSFDSDIAALNNAMDQELTNSENENEEPSANVSHIADLIVNGSDQIAHGDVDTDLLSEPLNSSASNILNLAVDSVRVGNFG